MLLTRRKKLQRISPEDHGRRMQLDSFERAIGQEGYTYELAKGVVAASEVPAPEHFFQVQSLRDQLTHYRAAHPDHIHSIGSSNEIKLLIASFESERHPDLAVYLADPPEVQDLWSVWIPELVIEVVSPSSAKRDYDEKPLEYLSVGVKEYWIVDKKKQHMLALTRWRGTWQTKTVKPTQRYSCDLLPGFKLDLRRVFAAAK